MSVQFSMKLMNFLYKTAAVYFFPIFSDKFLFSHQPKMKLTISACKKTVALHLISLLICHSWIKQRLIYSDSLKKCRVSNVHNFFRLDSISSTCPEITACVTSITRITICICSKEKMFLNDNFMAAYISQCTLTQCHFELIVDFSIVILQHFVYVSNQIYLGVFSNWFVISAADACFDCKCTDCASSDTQTNYRQMSCILIVVQILLPRLQMLFVKVWTYFHK